AAPNGLFEIRAAWQKAVRAATDYIYMEDQGFWSTEVLGWVNDAIRNSPNLRGILMASGGADPNDPVMPDQEILTPSVEQSVLAGLTATQRDQVRMFRRFNDRELLHTFTIVADTDNGDGTSDVEIDVQWTVDIERNAFAAESYLLAIGADEF